VQTKEKEKEKEEEKEEEKAKEQKKKQKRQKKRTEIQSNLRVLEELKEKIGNVDSCGILRLVVVATPVRPEKKYDIDGKDLILYLGNPEINKLLRKYQCGVWNSVWSSLRSSS